MGWDLAIHDSALAGSDYVQTFNTVSWANGESGPKTFTVSIVNDTAIESAESFNVTLSGASVATLGNLTLATVTILDNDANPNVYDVSQNLGPNPNAPWKYGWKTAINGNESSNPFNQLMVRQTPDPYADNGVPVMAWERVLYDYPDVFGNATGSEAIAGGGQGHLLPGTVWFLGTTQSKSYTETLSLTAGDTVDFMIGRGADNNLWGSTMKIKAQMTYQPNPGTLQFKSATYSVAENAGSVRIFVSRTGGSAGAASVSYATANGTVTAGADYTAASGTLNWANGDASDKFFDVQIANDSTPENHETFTVNLGGASVAAPGSPTMTTVTILSGTGAYDPTDTTDTDGDGLSDSTELYVTNSDPLDAYSLNYRRNGRTKTVDARWLFAAEPPDSDTQPGDRQAVLSFPQVINSTTMRLTLSGVPSGSKWDLYFSPNYAPSATPWTLLVQGTAGQTVFDFLIPSSPTGFFAAGAASDIDDDGLTDGYELLISHTRIDIPDTGIDTSGDLSRQPSQSRVHRKATSPNH